MIPFHMSVYLVANLIPLVIQLKITGKKHVPTTAMDYQIAKALNRYSDIAFIEHNEEKHGKQLYTQVNFRILLKSATDTGWE